jgi:membrane protein DedA with SNARE-associated domain
MVSGQLHTVVNWIVQTVGKLGYPGIFALMFLESSFFPFPSEVVIPPAAYLAAKGQMNLLLVILIGILGSIGGALFNYYLCLYLGRPMVLRLGKYVGLTEHKYARSEHYFKNHGEISTFVGRLIPGVRQYISLPAGLARMNVPRFVLFTGLGAGIWVTVLAWIGYFVGNNEALIEQYVNRSLAYILVFVALLVIGYVWWHRKKGDYPETKFI